MDGNEDLTHDLISQEDPARKRARMCAVVIAIALSVLYGVVFLARPVVSSPPWLVDALRYPSRSVYMLINSAFSMMQGERPAILTRSGIYLLLVAGLVPWAVLGMIRRGRPSDLGFRRPNRYAWRFLAIGYVCSIPFQVWMVRGSGFANPYLGQLERAGAAAFILYYCVNMLTEHFCLHGVILGVCRWDHRWPPPAPTVERDETDSGGRLLRWVGLAQPTDGARGIRGITRWLGLPDGCLPAMMTSTLLFGLVHLGKNPRELVLSLPGGLALAYIAYRSNTWLTTFVLHLATAGTALLMILLWN